MRNRRDRQARQLALIEEALAAGRSVVVDNVNATLADRRALIDAGHARNVAIYAARKQFVPPTSAEGFDRLQRVRAEAGRFEVLPPEEPSAHEEESRPTPQPAGHPRTIFLLSPASTSGERAIQLLAAKASFPLALKLRSRQGASLGEVFSFLSSLYFRGKLTYAQTFARPPAGLCGAFVITPGEGLRDPAERVTAKRLRTFEEVRIHHGDSRYTAPLLRDAKALALLAGETCRIVLLGSIASTRYVEPLVSVFGDRLLFPPTFVGRGDMSRGGLLLRCAREGRELEYATIVGATRHGPRPPRLPPPPRRADGRRKENHEERR
jgi:hypothetical protein